MGADGEVLTGGMNSSAWQVRAEGRRWAAKLVPTAQRSNSVAALAAAEIVDAGGIPSGRPVKTLDGERCADISEGSLALLAWVDGIPVAGGEHDQPVIGGTLGAAHAALASVGPSDLPRFHWIDIDAEHLDVEEWVRPAVRAAVAKWDAVSRETGSWAAAARRSRTRGFPADPAVGNLRPDRLVQRLLRPLLSTSRQPSCTSAAPIAQHH